jgi:hypothetical protein
MSSPSAYIAAFFPHWWALVSAGGLLGIDVVAEQYWPWLRRWLDSVPRPTRRKLELAALFFAILYSGYAAWRDEHEARLAASDPNLIASLRAELDRSRWAPLTGAQISDIRKRVGSTPARPLWIACETVNCQDLADNLGQAFDDPKWKAEVHHWGGMDISGTIGIEIEPDDETARAIRDAIEGATRLRIKIRSVTDEQFNQPQTLLVVGTKPF